MSDVLLYQTPDDGEITVANGTVTMTDGTESAVYISLFGANYDGTPWWGDTFENQSENKLTGRTQELLEANPITTGLLQRVLEAVKYDLNWMTPAPTVEVSIPALNTVAIKVNGITLTWSK